MFTYKHARRHTQTHAQTCTCARNTHTYAHIFTHHLTSRPCEIKCYPLILFGYGRITWGFLKTIILGVMFDLALGLDTRGSIHSPFILHNCLQRNRLYSPSAVLHCSSRGQSINWAWAPHLSSTPEPEEARFHSSHPITPMCLANNVPHISA